MSLFITCAMVTTEIHLSLVNYRLPGAFDANIEKIISN